MSLLKKLAGETAIYGLSSIIGRALNWLLIPMYTRLLPESEFGIYTHLYAWVGFLLVLYILRMETAFFRYGTDEKDRDRTYSTAFWSVTFTSLLFSCCILFFATDIAVWLTYAPDQSIYIRIFALVLALDTLAEIPLARLRLENKARRFAIVRLSGIAINIASNLFFLLLCPWLLREGVLVSWVQAIYDPAIGVGYIFLSNLLSSALVLLLLLPLIRRVKWRFEPGLWRTMFRYAAPLILASLAGIVNETIDRELLIRLLPFDAETNRGELGVYGACYKLAMMMSLFTQAFRYAAEPFFFSHARHKDAKILYARVTKYFTIAGVLAFIGITFYLDLLKYFLGEAFWSGLHIVPILLMANLFLGLYYNVSIWYKLTDRTMIGGWIALGGALITIVLNVIWIPMIGYTGSAWATLICYFSMTLACWWWGQKYYPVPYELGRITGYMAGGLFLYGVSLGVRYQFEPSQAVMLTVNTLLLGLFLLFTWKLEKREILESA